MNNLSKIKILSEEQKSDCLKDIAYRINNMLARDIMEFVNDKYKEKNTISKHKAVYEQSHVIEPALEISVVFGRQLLDFLRINYDKPNDKLNDLIPLNGKRIHDNDIFITSYNPKITDQPLNDELTITNSKYLISLLKVANKAATHLTLDKTLNSEFENMVIARMVILQLMLKYVPEIKTRDIWWTKKDEYKNAILE